MKTRIVICSMALAAAGFAHDEAKGKAVTITCGSRKPRSN